MPACAFGANVAAWTPRRPTPWIASGPLTHVRQPVRATVPAHLLESFRPDVYRASVVADWLKTFDSFLERARAILGAPEACGREWLARRLVLGSNHSSAAAILILRGANAGVATLPAGAARAARLATMRRAVSMEAAS
jgi:hypothetical protein